MDGSILFWEPRQTARGQEPFWQDLNLDQLVQELCHGRERFGLDQIWQTPVGLQDRKNRLELFRDLEKPPILQLVSRFVKAVSHMQQCLEAEQRLTNVRQRQWQRTTDVLAFDRELLELEQALEGERLQSAGMQRMHRCLRDHNRDNRLSETVQTGEQLLAELGALRLRLRCIRNQVEVYPGADREDYTQSLTRTFSGFRGSDSKDYTYDRFPTAPYLNRVEEGIAEGAAYLYPDVFERLKAFSEAHAGPISAGLQRLYEELPFYLSYLEYIRPLRDAGLPFCLPEFTGERSIALVQGFDLVMAHGMDGRQVVCNDFTASPRERLFTVTGANQGGKTTYARMVGQAVVLASLGLPVPGCSMQLYPVDRVLTHFEREETVETENGKLMDDLQRMKDLLDCATGDSLVLLNETFSSTTLSDALWLAEQTLDQLREKGSLCLYVTFLDSRLRGRGDLIGLQSTVGPGGERTYVVRREAADGRAYALAMAEHHHLMYEQIRERMQR